METALTAMSPRITAVPVHRSGRANRVRRHADLIQCLAFAAECAGETWQAGRLASDAARLTARADRLSREVRRRV